MPSYPVRQPDGQLAIWSTIVDHFTAFDCDIAECVEELAMRYRTSHAKLEQWCVDVQNGKIEYDYMRDWPDLLGVALARFGDDDETVKEAMERTPDELTRRYAKQVQHIWSIERRLDDMREKLAAVPAGAICAIHEAWNRGDAEEWYAVEKWLKGMGYEYSEATGEWIRPNATRCISE